MSQMLPIEEGVFPDTDLLRHLTTPEAQLVSKRPEPVAQLIA